MEKEFNIVEELKRYLKNTSKEQQQKDWEEIKEYGEFGPTVEEFLYKNPIVLPYNSTEEIEEYFDELEREDKIADAAKKVDLSPCFDELQNKAIEYVKENGQTLIREIITDMFVQAMSHTFFDTTKFRSEVMSVLCQMQNHN